MPHVKGMRWQTAVAVVLEGVQAHINRSQAKADQGQEFLSFLQEIQPPAKAPRVVGIKHLSDIKIQGRFGRPEPGSIPDRVLEIVGEFDEPVSMSQILNANHGAKHHSVILAVRALVRTKHLLATGATSKRRYELPGIKKARRA